MGNCGRCRLLQLRPWPTMQECIWGQRGPDILGRPERGQSTRRPLCATLSVGPIDESVWFEALLRLLLTIFVVVLLLQRSSFSFKNAKFLHQMKLCEGAVYVKQVSVGPCVKTDLQAPGCHLSELLPNLRVIPAQELQKEHSRLQTSKLTHTSPA